MYPDRPVTFALIYRVVECGGEGGVGVRTRACTRECGCAAASSLYGWTRPSLTLRIILSVEPRLGVIGLPSNGSASPYVSTWPPSSFGLGELPAASAAACGSLVTAAEGLFSAMMSPSPQQRGKGTGLSHGQPAARKNPVDCGRDGTLGRPTGRTASTGGGDEERLPDVDYHVDAGGRC